MVKITEMDDNITLDKQFETEVGPVVVMNKFNVSPGEVEEFLKVFAETTKVFNSNLDSFPLSCTKELLGFHIH